MFLTQDYRSRAIGVVAAIGVLITGVVVNGTTAAPRPAPVVANEEVRVIAHPATVSRLQPKCDPFC